MRVRLMLTCLCDAFYGDVGRATVRVLEHAGCQVEFDDRQTCCGQPAYNSGDHESAARVARHTCAVFAGDTPVVSPSGSCTAMVRHGYPRLRPPLPSEGERAGGEGSPFPIFELAEFLTEVLGITSWPGATYPKRVAFHRACHGRPIGLGDKAERLLATVPGIELVPLTEQEQCCGFGGAFAAKEGFLSQAIGTSKLDCFADTGADELVSGDMGCLMHLSGLASKSGRPIRTRHYAEVLAEVCG
ncbi:MAG: (Fe-S)-binding protein [Armatimonadetes bacterium]|nr:(Fe-S)-binding protein [Armatimonadota bacterium]